MDVEFEENLEKLVHRLEIGGRGQLLKLAGIWGSQRLTKYSAEIVADLISQLDDENAPERSRIEAAESHREGLPFLENRQPRESRLVDLEGKSLEQRRFLADGKAVLPIVVRAVEGVAGRHGAVCDLQYPRGLD